MLPSLANLPNKKSALDKELTILVFHSKEGGKGFGTNALYPLGDLTIWPAGELMISIFNPV